MAAFSPFGPAARRDAAPALRGDRADTTGTCEHRRPGTDCRTSLGLDPLLESFDLWFPVLQVHHDRRGEEQRGVGTDRQSDEQDQRQVLDGSDAQQSGTDEEQARDRQQ
jgi:hypothetical protein